MSDRENLDLGEDLDLDDQDSDWGEELDEDFPGDVASPDDAEVVAVTPAPRQPQRRRRVVPAVQPAGLGAIAGLLAGLAAIVGAATVFVAGGGDVRSLVEFDWVTDTAVWTNLPAYPVAMTWAGLAAALTLAMLTVAVVQGRARRAHQQVVETRSLLERLSELDVEKSDGWQDEELQADPEVSAFTDHILGAYRMQQARLTRYVGLEGEMHRLQKALADQTRADVDGSWENPAVEAVAEEALRFWHRAEQAESELADLTKDRSEQGPELVEGLYEARCWQVKSLDQVTQQGAAVERLAVKLGRLAETSATTPEQIQRYQRLSRTVEALREEVAALPARPAQPVEPQNLSRMVDRASKLAFQIAMEVARLGTKGERLLPITQDLEELTTELRALAGDDPTEGEGPDPTVRALENIRGRLADIEPEPDRDTDSAPAASQLAEEAAPAARSVAGVLGQIARGFTEQRERLEQMLGLAGKMTGVDLPTDTASASPAGDGEQNLLVNRFDPFLAGSPDEPRGLVADPFTGGDSIFNPQQPEGEGFNQSVLPGDPGAEESDSEVVDSDFLTHDTLTFTEDLPAPEEPLATAIPPLAEQPPATAPAPVPEVEIAATATPPEIAPVEPAAAVPVIESAPDEDRIYDLIEFDAVRLPLEKAADPAEDRVYDLEEFGAVRVG